MSSTQIDFSVHLQNSPKLIAHLMRGTQPPFWSGRYLADIVPQLRPEADLADINTIVQEAMRLGYPDAVRW